MPEPEVTFAKPSLDFGSAVACALRPKMLCRALVRRVIKLAVVSAAFVVEVVSTLVADANILLGKQWCPRPPRSVSTQALRFAKSTFKSVG